MPDSKYHRSERSPLVTFDYSGYKKELIFGYLATQNVNTANSVKISICKGQPDYDLSSMTPFDLLDILLAE